jgi:hypothetical protein
MSYCIGRIRGFHSLKRICWTYLVENFPDLVEPWTQASRDANCRLRLVEENQVGSQQIFR